VKEIFTVNCGEATDLAWRLAFESHHAPQRIEKMIQSAIAMTQK
jgi:hypothetical protein